MPYLQNRVAEVEENLGMVRRILGKDLEMSPVLHIPSDKNPADLATRATARAADLALDSEWMIGPAFLKDPRESWPATVPGTEESCDAELAGELRSNKLVSLAGLVVKDTTISVGIWETVVCTRALRYSNKLEVCLNILARVMRRLKVVQAEDDQEGNCGLCKKMVPGVHYHQDMHRLMSQAVTHEERMEAERRMLLVAMLTTRMVERQGKLASLLPKEENGLLVTTGRIGERSMVQILGRSSLPILMPESEAARLYMWQAHRGAQDVSHRSVQGTVARSREQAWVVRAGVLARKIVNSCCLCKKLRKKTVTQQMADLPPEIPSPAPPFTTTALDYAGPFKVRSEVNTRSRMKVWVLLYGCLATRALCLLTVAGYDTDSFLLRHQEFVARHGNPARIYSDRGTNLVKAGATLSGGGEDKEQAWDWSRVVRENKASNWVFTLIGCQWRNGFIERMVAITKQSLALALPNGKIPTYAEMITVLARIANSINSRPIGVTRVGDEQSDPQPLTPNMLMLGRSGNNAPAKFDLHETLPERCLYVQDILKAWWEKWLVQVFPHLLPCRKWQHRASNLREGDICQLKYEGAMVNSYRLVKVISCKHDSKGRVRTVRIAYRPKKVREKREVCNTKLTEEEVGVQRLCLLHPRENPAPMDLGSFDNNLLASQGEGAIRRSTMLQGRTSSTLTTTTRTTAPITPGPSSTTSSSSSSVLTPLTLTFPREGKGNLGGLNFGSGCTTNDDDINTNFPKFSHVLPRDIGGEDAPPCPGPASGPPSLPGLPVPGQDGDRHPQEGGDWSRARSQGHPVTSSLLPSHQPPRALSNRSPPVPTPGVRPVPPRPQPGAQELRQLGPILEGSRRH